MPDAIAARSARIARILLLREAPVVAPDDDPGWPLSWRVLVFLIPIVGRQRRRRQMERATDDPLVLLRQVFLAICAQLVGFGVVLAVLYPGSAPPHNRPAILVMGLLAFSVVGVVWSARYTPPLNCDSDDALRGSYRARFFLRVAFAEAAALVGFVGFFLTYDWWPYPAGVAITAFGFRYAAPTRANLRRDQERLADAGCVRSLLRVLRTPLPPTDA
jgi:hypothetical protein